MYDLAMTQSFENKKKLFILFVHQAFNTTQNGGGTRHFEIFRNWGRVGWSVNVVTSGREYLSGRPTRWGEESYGLRITQVPCLVNHHRSILFRKMSYLWFSVAALFACLRLKKVDIVLGTSPPISQALTALVAAKILRKPFLFEVRDLWPDFPIALNLIRNRFMIELFRRIERFLYRESSHIVINSPGFLSPLKSKGVDTRKISLVPNGVDVTMFDRPRHTERLRRVLGLDRKFTILYAGAIGIANDLDTLIEAAHQLREEKDIVFLLIGDGIMLNSIKSKCDRLNLVNVKFLSTRPKCHMREFVGLADLCYAGLIKCPVLHTTYPNKVFDYMAAGKPVLLALDGPMRSVIEEADAGVCVPPGDRSLVAKGILALRNDRMKCHIMGQNGRSFVSKRFSRDVQSEAFRSIISGLLKNNHKNL
jgi:glycosyltransferase involved in cell wall biosynthesis